MEVIGSIEIERVIEQSTRELTGYEMSHKSALLRYLLSGNRDNVDSLRAARFHLDCLIDKHKKQVGLNE